MMTSAAPILEDNGMQIDTALRRQLIEAMAATVDAHWQELTELDQAIGDGDHGTGMKRGFDAVLADADSW